MIDARDARLRAALLLGLVAGFGFVAGILADRLLFARPAAAAHAADDAVAREGVRVLMRGEPMPAAGPGRRMVVLPERMTSQLGLSAEQRAEIERILADDQAALRELTEQIQPAFAAVIERSRQRIEAMLTPEQRERWRDMPPMRLRIGGPDTVRD